MPDKSYVKRKRTTHVGPGPSADPQVYQDTENALRELLQQAMRDAKERDYKWGPYNRGWLAPSASWADDFPPSPHTPPGAPPVPAPPGWGSYEPVGPGSDLAQMMRRLETIAPGIRGLSNKIGLGPNIHSINRLLSGKDASGASGARFLGQGLTPLVNDTLQGSRGVETGDIQISPFQRGAGLFNTLAHELSHGTDGPWASGHPKADVIGAVAEMVHRRQPSQPTSLWSSRSREPVREQLDELFGEKPWYEVNEKLQAIIDAYGSSLR